MWHKNLEAHHKMHELFEMACVGLAKNSRTRAVNSVLNYGCRNADDIVKLDLKEFVRCARNAGPKTVEVVKKVQES